MFEGCGAVGVGETVLLLLGQLTISKHPRSSREDA